MSAGLDEVKEAVSAHVGGWQAGGGPAAIDAWFAGLRDLIGHLGGELARAADGNEDRHIAPDVLDSLREAGQAVRGVASALEDTYAAHRSSHGSWLE